MRLIVASAVALAGTLAPTTAIYAEESSRTMEEVVVTSRRKSESVQDVPLSVTAFGEEAIEQMKPRTLQDFEGMAPNVYIGSNAAGPSASAIYIRGVGYAEIEKTQSPQVGVIVDGVQMGSSTGQLIDLFDVESIEVNRGPQGVLFGKNTIGGNIVVNRTKPQYDTFGIKTSIEAGNYNSTTGKVRVNIPLSDNVAVKVGAIDRTRDGFYDNINLGGTAGDIDFQSQTMAIAFAPTDNLDVLLTYDHINDRSDTKPQDPRYNGDDRLITEADKDQPTIYDVEQLSLQVNLALSDNLDLHLTSAQSGSQDLVNQDFDSGDINGLAIPFAQLHTLRNQKYDITTHELRLNGALTDNLDFMLGYYYFKSDLDFRQDTNNVLQLPAAAFAGVVDGNCNLDPALTGGIEGIPLFRANPAGPFNLCQVSNARSTQFAGESVDSSAFFASVTFRPTEDLEVMVGARYIDEEKEAFNSYFDYSVQPAGPGAANPRYDDKTVPGYNEFDFRGYVMTPGSAYQTPVTGWSDTIITASASYRVNELTMAYLNYSEGFRSGGFSIRNASGPERAGYDPEDASQIELGIKTDLLDGRLRLNMAYYQLERRNAQFSSIITLPPGSIPGTTTYILNGGGSDNDGIELEAQWFISDNLRLQLAAGQIDVSNIEYEINCSLIEVCGDLPAGTNVTRGGDSDSRQPDWNASLRLAYDQSIGDMNFSGNIGYRRVGNFLLVNTGGGADQRLFEGGYHNIDAAAGLSWETNNGSEISVTLMGKNLTDEEWLDNALFLGGPTTGFQGWGYARTYAVELRYSM